MERMLNQKNIFLKDTKPRFIVVLRSPSEVRPQTPFKRKTALRFYKTWDRNRFISLKPTIENSTIYKKVERIGPQDLYKTLSNNLKKKNI